MFLSSKFLLKKISLIKGIKAANPKVLLYSLANI